MPSLPRGFSRELPLLALALVAPGAALTRGKVVVSGGPIRTWAPQPDAGAAQDPIQRLAAVPASRRGKDFVQSFLDYYPSFVDDDLALTEGTELPRLMRQFDWVVGLPHCQDPKLRSGCPPSSGKDHTRKLDAGDPYFNHIQDPRFVLCEVNRLPDLLGYALAKFDRARADRVLVLVGVANLTSCASMSGQTIEGLAAQLHSFFPTVWYMAKDVEAPGIRTAPPGLRDAYLRNGIASVAADAIAAASVAPGGKTRSVLGAWGAFLQVEDEQSCPSAFRFACASRKSARLWGESAEARRIGVEVRTFPQERYWGELARSRFLVSPLGLDIASTKTIEALLVLTVPIVQRGGFPVHDDMVRMGFPIVVVDSWDEITAERVEHWWAELSPRLERFRRNCLTTEAYWRMLKGKVTACR